MYKIQGCTKAFIYSDFSLLSLDISLANQKLSSADMLRVYLEVAMLSDWEAVIAGSEITLQPSSQEKLPQQ